MQEFANLPDKLPDCPAPGSESSAEPGLGPHPLRLSPVSPLPLRPTTVLADHAACRIETSPNHRTVCTICRRRPHHVGQAPPTFIGLGVYRSCFLHLAAPSYSPFLLNRYLPRAGATIMKRLFALVLVITLSTSAFGWNEKGHLVTARVAWRQLTEDQRAKVSAVLKKHPHYEEYLIARKPDGFTERRVGLHAGGYLGRLGALAPRGPVQQADMALHQLPRGPARLEGGCRQTRAAGEAGEHRQPGWPSASRRSAKGRTRRKRST